MLRWIDNGQTNDIHIILEYIDNEHFLIKNEHTMQYLSAHENNVDVFWTSKFFVPVTLYEVFRSTSGFVTTLNGRWIRTNENGFCQVNPDQCISTLKIEEYVSIVCQTTNQDVICISDDDSDSDLPPPTNTGTTSLPPPPPTNTGTTSLPPPPTNTGTTSLPPPPPTNTGTTSLPPSPPINTGTTSLPPPPPINTGTTSLPPPPPTNTGTTSLPPSSPPINTDTTSLPPSRTAQLETESDDEMNSFGTQLERELETFNSSKNFDTSTIIKRGPGRPKGSKNKNDTDKPKRIRTAGQLAFTAFQKDHRKKLKRKYPDLSFSEISKKLGKRWKNLSEDERQYYFS